MKRQETNSILQVNHETGLKHLGSRIGLYYGQTTVPVFLLALPRVRKVEIKRFEFAGQILEQIEKANEVKDETEVRAWNGVLAFFQSGGKLAWVMLTPFEKKQDLSSALIGKSKGLRQSTGLRGLDRMSTYADILVLPQMAEVSDLKKWKALYQAIIDSTQNISSLFCIVDFPYDLKVSELASWRKHAVDERTASFYPHFFEKKGNKVSSSVISAALFQRINWEHGITESAANTKIQSLNYVPCVELLSSESDYLNSIGINSYRYIGKKDLRIWGFQTLDSKTDISTCRTKMSLEEAVKTICDSFVFESVNDSICEDAELAVSHFLQSLKNLFDSQVAQPFEVKCNKKKKGKESVLDVQCKFKLPHSIQKVFVGVHSAA